MAHVLEEVGRIGEYLAEPPRGPDIAADRLDEESALVLEAMPRRGASNPEELAAKAGLGLRTVLRRLSLLEMAGLVVRREGGVALAPATKKAGRRTSTIETVSRRCRLAALALEPDGCAVSVVGSSMSRRWTFIQASTSSVAHTLPWARSATGAESRRCW